MMQILLFLFTFFFKEDLKITKERGKKLHSHYLMSEIIFFPLVHANKQTKKKCLKTSAIFLLVGAGLFMLSSVLEIEGRFWKFTACHASLNHSGVYSVVRHIIDFNEHSASAE